MKEKATPAPKKAKRRAPVGQRKGEAQVGGKRLPRNWKAAFIEALVEERSVTHACRVVGMARKTAYKHRKEDPAFGEEWDEAVAVNLEDLEASAMRRAIDGTLEPILYQGKTRGARRVYETGLTIFMMKTRMRDRYGQAAAFGRPVDEIAREIREATAEMNGSIEGPPPDADEGG